MTGIAHTINKFYVGGPNPNYYNLPSEYTQLDYIENRTCEYIDTGVNITSTIKVEADFQITEKKSGFEIFIFGNYKDNSSSRLRAGITAKNVFNTDIGRNISYSQTSNVFARTTVTITATSGTNPDTTILLFASRRDNRVEGIGKFKLYSCKIYDNNNLIRHFIPCIRNEDSIVGLLDIINNNKFYTSVDIISSEYQKVEYLESNGYQYIDAGFMPASNISSYITFNTTNLLNNEDPGSIFGVHDNSDDGIRYNLETWTENATEYAGHFWLGSNWTSYNPLIIPNTKLTIGQSNILSDFKILARNDNSTVTINNNVPSINKNIYIFGYNGQNDEPSNLSKTKIYYLVFFEQYSKKRQYIPVIRKLDNKPGLYDVSNQNFVTNSGENEFLYGSIINDFIGGPPTPNEVAHLVSKLYIGENELSHIVTKSYIGV